MKKHYLLLPLLILCIPCMAQQQTPNNSISDSFKVLKIERQPRFYINVHSGYAIGLGSTFKFYPDNITQVQVEERSNGQQTTTFKNKEQKKGLGDGFRVGVGFSYIVNDFINVGLDVDYFRSKISKVKDSSFTRYNADNTIDYSYNEKYKISYDATLLTFTPNITFKAISRPKFFIYNKIGAVLVIRPNSIQKETQNGDYKTNSLGSVTDSSSFTVRKYDWGLKNPAYGFMGGLGGQVKLSENIRAFAEVQFTHVVFRVRNRILTTFLVDGKEMISSLPISSRELIFKDSFVSTANTNPNEPTITVYERFPITYLGLQAGIAYRF
ncbi:MAG: hypothetical protein M3015_06755 [Bacteroidota bacterium]|nr:hypothetical protein [Bacteroidota bacterium]